MLFTIIGYAIGAVIFMTLYTLWNEIPDRAKDEGWGYKFDGGGTKYNNVKVTYFNDMDDLGDKQPKQPKIKKQLEFDKGEDYIGTDGIKYTRFVKK